MNQIAPAQMCELIGKQGMQIASVMAVADGGSKSRSVIETALTIGNRFDALTALVQINPPDTPSLYPNTEFASTELIDSLMAGIRENIADRQRRFDDDYRRLVDAPKLPVSSPDTVPRAHSFSVMKLMVTGYENREIAMLGRGYDIVVVGAPTPASGGIDSAALEAALMDTGRPVLIASSRDVPKRGTPVTVGWDGSRESALSIRNALPFMVDAERVEVIHVARHPCACGTDMSAIRRFLHMHDIDANVRIVPEGRQKISEVLLEAAHENGRAILVMGAFGHSAMSEFMFGGVTREVMTVADVPLLLSH